MWNPLILRGIRLPKHKKRTQDLAVTPAEDPSVVYLSMAMHTGAPAMPVVEVGAEVKRGQKVADAQDNISGTIHSPVSGKVVAIQEMEGFRGACETIVIQNDYSDTEDFLPPLPQKPDKEAFVSRLKKSGITGQGGAGFPTWFKLDVDVDDMEVIIVNATECEPYSTSDARAMIEEADRIVRAVEIVQEVYQTSKAYIAIEAHMQEEKRALAKALEQSNDPNIEIFTMGNKYPQGYSDTQLYAILGKEIPFGDMPSDVHVIQSNVSTFKAIYDAVVLGKPLIERVITVTGDRVQDPQNLLVRIGTPVKEILEQCETVMDQDTVYVNGGPMMGKAFTNKDTPIAKDTTTILALNQPTVPEETPCIRCARCIQVCPVGIQPIVISNCYRNKEFERVPYLVSERCINCGACTAVCPANISLLADIEAINKEYKKLHPEEEK